MRKEQEAIWDYCRFPCIGDWLRTKKQLNAYLHAKSINQNGLPGVNKKIMKTQPKANNNMISLRTYLLKSQNNTIPTMTQGLQRFRLQKSFTAASEAFESQSRRQTPCPLGPFLLIEPLGGILQLIYKYFR
jgi:hypothetical protein